MSKKELFRRYVFFVAGLFVNSLGISLITKANLGTSPISSIPYTLSLGFPLSLGMFTMIFSVLLMVVQLVILRKRFSKELWLQLPISVLFSAFIDLTMAMLFFIHLQTYITQMISLLIGCLILGFGVFMEMTANVVMLPGECTVRAISSTWHTDFGKTKIAVDVTMALTAGILGLALYWEIAGVREGSLISALLVGFLARIFNRMVGEPVQTLLCDAA